jgi:hypothetical protein
MLRARWADLHLHTVLSPCAEVEMIPPLIVARALELGLEWIAVTDHNSAGNVRAVLAAAEGTGLTVTPGLEVESREEVHLVCLFDTAEQAELWGALIARHMPLRKNDERFFGAQFVVDAHGEYVRTEERLLATSADLSVEEVARGVAELGGIVIAAHVDRPANSLLANLGLVPPGLELAGLELSRWADPGNFRRAHPELAGYGLVASGDAHRLSEIQRRTAVISRAATVADLRKALRNEDGCSVEVA